MEQIEGNIVDIRDRSVYPGIVFVENGRIRNIVRNNNVYDVFISPGFIDAHVHVESSMLIPEQFSKLSIQKGTVAIVSDPHEIANVLGRKGVDFMMENARYSKIKMFFTIPSCVPSTPFDVSGAIISSSDVEEMASSGKYIGLSEMMNVSGVLNEDNEVVRKLDIAKKYGLPIDGHAPGLRGEGLEKYIAAGISTDHECTTVDEGKEKVEKGMKILIREGSAAKNYDALKDLISVFPDKIMFCTDDSHPDELIHRGEIDKIVKKALLDGYDLFDVLKIAAINPVEYYKLDVGTLQIGDSADFVVFRDLKTFEVLSVYINGIESFSVQNRFNNGKEISVFHEYLNFFHTSYLNKDDIRKPVSSQVTAIRVIDKEIVTEKSVFKISSPMNNLESDLDRDILKLVYLNRYENKPPQVAFISGMGLKQGACATSIAHDSHNIIAVGTNDDDIITAINTIIEGKGGVSIASGDYKNYLSLPIAGIMTDESGDNVALYWNQLNEKMKEWGCILTAPFMTLSFMSLIVIPELKIGEKGLFEFSKFNFIDA